MDQIMISHYNFKYATADQLALNDISLTLPQGSFTVLLGPSGCGKSTLLRQLKSVLKPHGESSGEILYEGKALDTLDLRQQSQSIGFVMQDPDHQIVTDKVWHELAFGLESLGMDSQTIRLRVAEMASYFGIQDWFYKAVAELSGGQKQLLNLASVMAMHPSILILDEPTSQLDPIAASDFLETIKKLNRDLGLTILMTEHRLEEVLPMADQAILMEGGRVLYAGTPMKNAIYMYTHQHTMFSAMPAPMWIALQAEHGKFERMSAQTVQPDSMQLPMTAGEGRVWLMQQKAAQQALAVSEASGMIKQERKSDLAGDEKKIPIISLEEVWFRYEKDLPDVVKGLNMKVYPGEFYAMLGGNGTGKSTTLSMISRVRRPYRGKIMLNGKDIRKYKEEALYQGFLGVVPQNPQSLFVKKTVRLELFEMIGGTKEKLSRAFPVDMEKKEVVAEIAALTHLNHLMDRHPFDLSGGEQQRLALAKILLLRPKVLLMDEPTKGLDAAFKKEFADILMTLKQHGVTILMISHDIEFCARYSDRCGLFFDGGIVTENDPKTFFAGNSFYTTTANRMARQVWPEAVTPEDVLGCLMEGGSTHA